MRSENCRNVWEKTPWPRSLPTVPESKVMRGAAAARVAWEMPCATASRLKSSSQRWKLPVLRQAASADPAVTVLASASATVAARKFARRIAPPERMTALLCRSADPGQERFGAPRAPGCAFSPDAPAERPAPGVNSLRIGRNPLGRRTGMARVTGARLSARYVFTR